MTQNQLRAHNRSLDLAHGRIGITPAAGEAGPTPGLETLRAYLEVADLTKHGLRIDGAIWKPLQ